MRLKCSGSRVARRWQGRARSTRHCSCCPGAPGSTDRRTVSCGAVVPPSPGSCDVRRKAGVCIGLCQGAGSAPGGCVVPGCKQQERLLGWCQFTPSQLLLVAFAVRHELMIPAPPFCPARGAGERCRDLGGPFPCLCCARTSISYRRLCLPSPRHVLGVSLLFALPF